MEVHPGRQNRRPSKTDRGSLGGSRKETVISPLCRKGTAMPLWYFHAVTSWVLQRAVQRAGVFTASEDAVHWPENPHLGKVGRDPGSEGSGEKWPMVEAT